MGPRNHVLDRIKIPVARGNFGGYPALSKAMKISAEVYANKISFKSSITTGHAMRP